MDRHDLPVYVYERFAKSTHHLEPKLRMSGVMPPLPIHGMYKDRLPLPAEYIIIINSVGIESLKVFSYNSQDTLGPHCFGNPEFHCLIGKQGKSVVKMVSIKDSDLTKHKH